MGKGITVTLDEHELRMVLHGLVCERDSISKTIAHADGMPHFKTYMTGKRVCYERLIERLTLAK